MIDDAIADVLDDAEVVADEEVGEVERRRRSMNRFSTCAWIDTSSAATDSSQTRNSGFTASARAMPMRARWPPENWCGKRRISVGSRPTRFSCSADVLDLLRAAR